MKCYLGWVWWLILGLGTVSCGGSEPVFPIEPDIAFESLTPTRIRECADPPNCLTGDELVLKIRYKDGDGDIGNKTPTTSNSNFFLIDSRDSSVISYNLPYLTPETRKPSIQGVITVNINGIERKNPRVNQETVVYTVYLLDRAGHPSNKIIIPAITVVP
ncbi:MAG: hypothetical protein LC115_13930 [Bacteroidia bacterium]|nr:hypothetical protein [Bacteroidia bacterium]